MTIGQSEIMRYVKSNFPEVKTEEIGLSVIRITDDSGKTKDLSINIFGDILEMSPDGMHQIIAKSDLPHNLDNLPIYARPKAWETL